MSGDDDTLVFAPELAETATAADAPVWRVLSVDDDEDVHAATSLALRGETICGRRLSIDAARSAAEALERLASGADYAVVLLDVVMETEHAGLELVGRIRRELGLHRPRIILRTGQPGFAPELNVVRDLDINDYRTKQTLTRTQLLTSLTAAIRAFEQIVALDRSNAGLERLVDACARIQVDADLEAFAADCVTGLGDVLGRPVDGALCLLPSSIATGRVAAGLARLHGGSGRFAGAGRRLDALADPALAQAVLDALTSGRAQFAASAAALPLPSRTGAGSVLLLAAEPPFDPVEQRLAGLYVHSIAALADSHRLLASLHDTAYIDSLLGIGNRAAIAYDIDGVLQQRHDGRLALELVDIDHFSEINEAFGDAFGDALLRAVAERLHAAFGSDDRVGRVANDTFAVLADGAELEPRRLNGLFAEPFKVNGTSLAITASFARVDLTEQVHSGSEAIKFGYSALKRAKAAGPGSHERYSREFGVEIAERTRMLQDLHSAFDRNQLFLTFQPQLDIDGSRVVGLEALMRWRSDSGRLVPPDLFVPIAEQSGLILDLGAWVLKSALAAQQALARAGHGDIRMAINVSMAQMLAPEFEGVLDAALADSGADPKLVELEITESVAMHSPDQVASRLQRLRRRGVAIAIDDFGTGFSSLAYLERLPADRLKIDRSFVGALGDDSSGGRIAEMVIELGKTLGLKVLAEGVENEAQRERLAALGCDELQGYLFSRPLEQPALLDWLRQRA